MRKKNLAICIAIVACAAFALLIGAFSSFNHENAEKQEPEVVGVVTDANHKATFALTKQQIEESGIETEIAKEGKLLIKTCVPGKITTNPNKYAHVVSPTNAVVYEVVRDLGENVKAGDLLATLESREMAEAKAEYLAAARREALMHTLLEREQNLKDKKISAEQDFLKAQTDAEEAKIALTLSKQKLQALGLNDSEIRKIQGESESNLRLYLMRAPIDGTIIKKHITTGEVLNPNEESFVIADLSKVLVEMAIYPKDLESIKKGQYFEVTADHSSKSAKALILYLSPTIDEESHTATAIGEINNSTGSWRPGSFVCASIITNEVQAPVVIKKEGLQNIEGTDYVFVKTKEGFEQREVTVGLDDGTHLEITSGLKNGEVYVGNNSFLFKAELTKVAEDD